MGNDPVNAADPTGKWVFAFKIKIDAIAGFGVGVEVGVYVGTDSEGNLDAGVTGAVEAGSGFDVAVGATVAIGGEGVTTEALNGTFSEVEAGVGPISYGKTRTPGKDPSYAENFDPEEITDDVKNGEGPALHEFSAEAGVSPVSGSFTKGISGKFGTSDINQSDQQPDEDKFEEAV